MLRLKLTYRLPMLSTRLRQTNTDIGRCFKRVIWWWRICGIVDSLVFMPSWKSESTIHFIWHKYINDKTYVLQLLDNWNIPHTFNVTHLFAYHSNDEELYQTNSRMRGFDVGWLCITGRISSEGHNLGYRCLFSTCNWCKENLRF